MDRQEKLNLMWEMFVHPESGYAEQVYADGTTKLKQGTYFFRAMEGTCTHEPQHKKKDCPDIADVEFTKQHLAEHLKGKKTYAPYQLSSEGKVKWLCFDVDAYNDVAEEKIRDIVIKVSKKVHARLGPNSFLVEKSGSKGYHVWVFFERPLDVHLAFALGHELVQTIPTTDTINIEIYPKQQSKTKTYGNTVKLPLGIHQKTGTRCLFVDSTFTPYEDQWEKLLNVRRISPDWVEENVDAYVPPPPDTRQFTPRVPLCLAEVMAEGCQEGLRDEAAFKQACYLRSKGIPEDLVMSLMDAWNRKNNPPMDADDLATKVEQAYTEEYSWKPCFNPAFDHLCKSECVYFDKKLERRWSGKKKEDAIGIISKE